MKKETRMCLVCRARKDKYQLLRICCDKEKNVMLDETGKSQGRGAYICYSEDCLQKTITYKRLDNIFKIKVNEKLYSSLKEKQGVTVCYE